jgi:death on curing protein
MTASQEPMWVRQEVVLAIHARQVAEHGGADGIRDMGLLTSALDRPRNLLAYADPPPDVPALASAYAFGIVRNHPFVDGNKRTAYVMCRTFLALNGHDLEATAADKYTTFLQLAEGSITEGEFADWLRRHLARIQGA